MGFNRGDPPEDDRGGFVGESEGVVLIVESNRTEILEPLNSKNYLCSM